MKRTVTLLLAVAMLLSLCACGKHDAVPPALPAQTDAVTVTDMIGRQVEVVPGSYKRVVCIGAGALRLYSYIGDPAILAGVEDIDNTTLAERPKMFDAVARPYVLAFGDVFNTLPSCGVGGPMDRRSGEDPVLRPRHRHLCL